MKRTISLIAWCIWAVLAIAQNKHYTVIVSLDGFRWDYTRMYNTPFFDEMAQQGTSAVMLPSFPSKTFPNHYTLATGLVPDHHGIVANTFWDPQTKRSFSLADVKAKTDVSFYGGEPIWATAHKQGVKTACVYWVASELGIQGIYPDYYRVYDKGPRLSFAERIAEAKSLLAKPEDERPQLVMMYFEEPDHIGHHFGPQSKETKRTVEEMDALMHQLWLTLQELPFAKDINLIITADHGMTMVSPDRLIPVDKYIRKEWIERIEGNLPALIYTRKGCADKVIAALKDVPHIRAYKRKEIPSYLHFGSNERAGDVVVIPELGYLFTNDTQAIPGQHGYDPGYSDMQVMFRAIGPDFKKGYEAPKFRNVHIYPLLAHLLQIKPAPNDGNLDEVRSMLETAKD